MDRASVPRRMLGNSANEMSRPLYGPLPLIYGPPPLVYGPLPLVYGPLPLVLKPGGKTQISLNTTGSEVLGMTAATHGCVTSCAT